MVMRYQQRLSGPKVDRIDMHPCVPRVEFEKLTRPQIGETSEAVRARVTPVRVRR